MIKKEDLPKTILLSAFLAIFFVSSLFLSEIVSYKGGFLLAFLYIILIAGVYGIALVSENKKTTLLKWLFSLPFSYFVFQYFWETDYAIRALNWCFPYYGEQSAGGASAGMFLVVICAVLFLVSVAAAFSYEIDDELLERKQFIVSVTFGIAIIVTVIMLEQRFPAYESIMLYLNS